MTEKPKRLFDDGKFWALVQHWNELESDSPMWAINKRSKSMEDFLDSEIRRNVREFAEKIRPDKGTYGSVSPQLIFDAKIDAEIARLGEI